mmetsp:Transcript_48058/g.79609  ORF Transcript_48058/g.79609 Transcript_48058/m.79609 type:complete len:311 (+) Transcript_48058:90-1022(+)|eukprot:CAMPEP_0119299412 /NCGR_PEP_ID=MMETSP1333-20130426/1496_1 /TAXON_ID=418940 /ORGANISM="Scyphosphaera apsteinii, Strain RCC1455" /LENGTH=310 /DNA_ID=CAMNT_0007300835 /DNA_START=122 /DNA_END=1054 /DNA_ORIENTATION=-
MSLEPTDDDPLVRQGRPAAELLRIHRATGAGTDCSHGSGFYLNLKACALQPCELDAVFSLEGVSELGLSGNPSLGMSGAIKIAEALSNGWDARLYGVYVSRCNLSSDGGLAIARALSNSSTSKVARVGLNTNGLEDSAAIHFAPLLRQRSLLALGLSDNAIGDQAASAIAEALYANETLQRLFLNYNTITCIGALAFARLLLSGKAKMLRRLGLAHNMIDEAGGSALAAGALAASDTLELICLFGNPFLSAADDFAQYGALAARHRLSQLLNVNLNGLSVVRIADGTDHYFYHSDTLEKDRFRDISDSVG